jgi:hypothetical protein
MAELVWKRAPDRVFRRYTVEVWGAFLGDKRVALTVTFPEGWGGPPDTGWEVPGLESPDGTWPEDRDINDSFGYLPTLEEAKAAAEASLRKYQVIP